MAEGAFKEFKEFKTLQGGQILGVSTRARDGWSGERIWKIKKGKKKWIEDNIAHK